MNTSKIIAYTLGGFTILGCLIGAAVFGVNYFKSDNPVTNSHKVKRDPSWSASMGYEMAQKIAISPRLADVANYLLSSANHSILTENDIYVLNSVDEEIKKDDLIAQAFMQMRQQGYPAEVKKIDTGYEIRGEWLLDTPAGSPYVSMFPNGARLLLNGESISAMLCGDGKKAVVMHALVYKRGAPKVSTSLVEEGGRWRAFVDAANPYAYRILADANCILEKKLEDLLSKPNKEQEPLIDAKVIGIIGDDSQKEPPKNVTPESKKGTPPPN